MLPDYAKGGLLHASDFATLMRHNINCDWTINLEFYLICMYKTLIANPVMYGFTFSNNISLQTGPISIQKNK